MWDTLLLALDEFDSGRRALDFTGQLARATRARVRVLHVREILIGGKVPALESGTDAQLLVDQAVLRLHLEGVEADGLVCTRRDRQIPRRIVEESVDAGCGAIVLGSRRLRGLHRVASHHVREEVIRLSRLPVITAPPPAEWSGHRSGPGDGSSVSGHAWPDLGW
jgi:nucleotide-binding universal stress UspA family protein